MVFLQYSCKKKYILYSKLIFDIYFVAYQIMQSTAIFVEECKIYNFSGRILRAIGLVSSCIFKLDQSSRHPVFVMSIELGMIN